MKSKTKFQSSAVLPYARHRRPPLARIFFFVPIAGFAYVVLFVFVRMFDAVLVEDWIAFTAVITEPVAEFFTYTQRFTRMLTENGYGYRVPLVRHVMSITLVSTVLAVPYYILMVPRYSFEASSLLIRYGMRKRSFLVPLSFYLFWPFLLLVFPFTIISYEINFDYLEFISASVIHISDFGAIKDALLILLLPWVFFRFLASEYALLRIYVRYRSILLRRSIPRRLRMKGVV